ncbi:TPA: hypothetical protein DD449_04510 [Candidatus Berkelbacteria bacterium]|uniref:Uncharacterized protein n=1 Tax=Berkelbacteria bacterium GW2011_GWE1_39_12 TaxID=1618337 RepID=A0A0G4B4K1_9BACT|nr:MAG: hypothetical protein UT28_C0001G0523 [Berkelbacteria bacterium GW2011_GWE1_39_12]HBO60918.1 hypothetical protein [Candidatus Berkelbacteria bacterium]
MATKIVEVDEAELESTVLTLCGLFPAGIPISAIISALARRNIQVESDEIVCLIEKLIRFERLRLKAIDNLLVVKLNV